MVVFKGSQGFSEVPSVVLKGCQRFSVVLSGFEGFSVVLRGSQWF